MSVSRPARLRRNRQLCVGFLFIALVTFVLSQAYQSNPGDAQLSIGSSRLPLPPWTGVAPHFEGEYGIQAARNLSIWSSSLFERTFQLYRQTAIDNCPTEESCVLARMFHHAPEPTSFSRYDLFNPVVTCPNGSSLARVGGKATDSVMEHAADGGKWLCSSELRPPCTIFSLGSEGDFSFEQAMLDSTECLIFTFDCTYDGKRLSDRHRYFKYCLGSQQQQAASRNFTTLRGAMAMAGVEKINLLKIDIEGFEFDVMATWRASDGIALPEQIAIEVHHSERIYYGTPAMNRSLDFHNLLWPVHDMGAADLALFFQHFASMGYAIASREDNTAHGTCCSEFLLLKVADWV